jgi:hypothetical protein
VTDLAVHPELVARYRIARIAWANNPGVRQAAVILGMDEREYCDRFVRLLGPITVSWAHANGSGLSYVVSSEHAFEAAAIPGPPG